MQFFKKYYKYIIAILLTIMFILEVTSALQESQTIDEGVHLAAGYSYLMTGDFRMNTEHPPLIKEISALPLVLISSKFNQPFDKPSWEEYNQWQFAKDLIYNNTISADTMLFLGRLPNMLLSLILGFFIFRWSKGLFGVKAGLFSLALYAFSPNLIAHSRYVTTDTGVTLFFFLTIYYFHKYLKQPNYKSFTIFSIFFALAQVVKFSAVLLLPILVIYIFILFFIKKPNIDFNQIFKRIFLKLIILFSITFTIIFTTYGFEIKKPADDLNVKTQYEKREQIIRENQVANQLAYIQQVIKLTDPKTTLGQAIINISEKIPVPAYSYVNGFIKVLAHNKSGHMSYLMGGHSNFGWWYYFPVAFMVKTPLSTQILILFILIFASVSLIKRITRGTFSWPVNFESFKNIPLHFYSLVIPPFLYFAYSLTSNLNLGLRHVFIIYPFVFVLIGWLLTIRLIKYQKLFNLTLAILLMFYLISSSMIYPHYLAYFNEAVGGPAKGPQWLVDSNIDWGQDVKKLKKYLTSENIDHVCMSYFGQAELDYYQIDFRYLPDLNDRAGIKNINCVVAISVSSLMSNDKKYSWLLDLEPNKKIGYSIYLYDLRK